MAIIEVRCPVCSEWENIDITEEDRKKNTKGLLTINITSGVICEHEFFVYLDKNLMIRDCFVADFKIEAPDIFDNQEHEKNKKLETDEIKADLIKYNIPEIIISYIIRTIFLGQKILLISDQKFIYGHLINFFSYLFEDTFTFQLSVVGEEDYTKNQERFQEYIIFKKRDIFRDPNNIINPKKMEIQSSIVQQFFTEYDSNSGLLKLKNEIQKIYTYSKTVAKLIENYKVQPLTAKMIIEHTKDKHNDKIKSSYLKFLLEIVENYFNVEIPKIN